MDEFANMSRERAAAALRRIYRQVPTRETDPILELISTALGDGAGDVQSPEDYSVTSQQWLDWNQWALNQPQELARVTLKLMEREGMNVPEQPDAIRSWAAWLVVETLDQLTME